MSKSLIIYFSRADENYDVGYIHEPKKETTPRNMPMWHPRMITTVSDREITFCPALRLG